MYCHVIHYIVCSLTDGYDVHANSPLDSTLLAGGSQTAGGMQAAGGTQSTTVTAYEETQDTKEKQSREDPREGD